MSKTFQSVLVLMVTLLGSAAIYLFGVTLLPHRPPPRTIAIPNLPRNPNAVDPVFQASPTAKAYYGYLAGSSYRIEVPNNWNGELIMYAHGFRGSIITLTVSNLPIREAVLQQGYAWAASSYRANGYNPEDGVQDTLILREWFKQNIGNPKRTYIYGTSMGGHITVASLEQYPDIYDGGLSECGVVSGIGEFDYLLSYTLLASYFAGADLTAAPSAAAAAATLTQQVVPTLGTAADKLTEAGKRFRSSVIHLSGGHRPFAEEGFAAYYLSNMPTGIGFLFGQTFKEKAVSNADFAYTIDPGFGVNPADLNKGVKRIKADPNARSFEQHYEFTRFKGNLRVPLLTIHNTGDTFVPISLEQQYRKTVDKAGASRLLVQRAVRRIMHCDFTPAERTRAWNDLVLWVTKGVRPEGEDFLGSMLDIGRKWTEPLRADDPGHP
jgi:dienelactone hydrolase